MTCALLVLVLILLKGCLIDVDFGDMSYFDILFASLRRESV